jgi:E1A/CREB-binding protein
MPFQWVQCDKCKAWQHQICALFNPKIVDPEAEYTCAKCFLKEKDNEDVDSLEPSTILGARELPRTRLSDHIEQRLSERLVQERQQRAIASGKSVDEVVVLCFSFIPCPVYRICWCCILLPLNRLPHC